MPNWKKVIVSGSNVSQLNNDGVYLKTIGDGVISSSAQLTTEFDTRYLNTSGDNVISSSAQLTTEFDTRYLNTTGDGVISSSAQVTLSSTNGFTAFSSSIASSAVAGNFQNVTTNQITLGTFNLVNQFQIVTTKSGSLVLSGSTNYVLDTFMTGSGQASGFEYNYVAHNSVTTGRMGTIKLIMGDGGGISFFETSTPDIDPFDAPTTNLVFSFDANGTAPNNGRFLVSNNTDANLIIIYERKEYIISY